jgi:hypothetical protein
MLHRLSVARYGDRSLCVDAGIERRQGRPAEQDDEEQEADDRANADVAPRIVRVL